MRHFLRQRVSALGNKVKLTTRVLLLGAPQRCVCVCVCVCVWLERTVVDVFPRLLRSRSLVHERFVSDDVERERGGVYGLDVGGGQVVVEEVFGGEAEVEVSVWERGRGRAGERGRGCGFSTNVTRTSFANSSFAFSVA